MDEHHRARKGAVFIERVLHGQVVVVLDPHAAEDDHVDLGLQRNPCQKLVVRFAGDRKDRQLLRFDQGVEHIDHRDVGPDHVPRNHPLRRIHRRPADLDHVGIHRRTTVTRRPAAGENPPQQRLRTRHLHRTTEETHLVAGADPAASREHLQRHLAVGEPDHLRKRDSPRTGHFRKFIVGDVVGLHRDDVAGDMDDLVINFTHLPHSVPQFSLRSRPPASGTPRNPSADS